MHGNISTFMMMVCVKAQGSTSAIPEAHIESEAPHLLACVALQQGWPAGCQRIWSAALSAPCGQVADISAESAAPEEQEQSLPCCGVAMPWVGGCSGWDNHCAARLMTVRGTADFAWFQS